MSKEWFHSENIPNSVENIKLGKKARDLIFLKRFAVEGGFRVPDFSIIPAETVSGILKRGTPHGERETNIDFTSPQQLSDSMVAFFSSAVSGNITSFQEAFKSVSNKQGFPVLRSSLTLDEGKWESFAGVNYTACPGLKDEAEYLKAGLSKVLAGLYKPYSEWYLRRHDLASEDRAASIIFTEFIEAPTFGTFSISGSKLEIYIQSPDQGHEENLELDLDQVSSFKGDGGVPSKIVQVAKFLREKISSPVEVEFRVDLDGELFINQMRDIKPMRQDNRVPKDGLIVCNLVEQEISIDAFRGKLKGFSKLENVLFITDLNSASSVNTFSVVAILQEEYGVKDIHLIVAHEGVKPINHLLTVLEEDAFLRSLSVLDKKVAMQYKDGMEFHPVKNKPYSKTAKISPK